VNKQKVSIIFSFFLLSIFLLPVSAELKIAAAEKATNTTTPDELGRNENDLGLKAGESVPAFESNTYDGESINLDNLLANGSIMVIFYRGGWCPFCNYQVRQITEAFDKFQQRNVTPVLISVDNIDGAMLIKEAYEIPFPVLSDSNLAAHESFKTVIELDNSKYEKYKKFGVDLEAWSGLEHHKMAAPGIFLVNGEAQVLWSHVALDFKTRPNVEQLLSVIDNNLK
jgi:peroxiredoxin